MPGTEAWFGAGTVRVGRVGWFCNAGPVWQSENLLNSSHFLRVRERIETTSAILPSTTNNYKGSLTSGFSGCLCSAQYQCFKSLFCLPLLIPKIRQKLPREFSGLKWPHASFRPPSAHAPTGPVGSVFLCSLPASPSTYPLISVLPEIQFRHFQELQPVYWLGIYFFMNLSNSAKKFVTLFVFFLI